MHLEIIHITPKLFNKASDFFSENFFKKLKLKKPGTFTESLVARYLIELESKRINALYGIVHNYSNISHKKDLVFIGISDSKIGIDIEIIKERDNNLLEKFSETEYKTLGKKNWRNFYTLWTAKEAIIKYENLLLDDIEDITLIESLIIEDSNILISGINFQNKLIFNYNNKEFVVHCGMDDNLIFSVCISSKIG